jgi:sigma-B regulation protein RsbU (phosphoserine phosphatase)
VKTPHGLTFKFVVILLLLGGLVSFTMYSQYMRYINDSTYTIMRQVLHIVVRHLEQAGDPADLIDDRLERNAEYWALVEDFAGLRRDFDMLYIYYMVRNHDDRIAFLIGSTDDADTPLEYYDMDYIDPELRAAWDAETFYISNTIVTNEFGKAVSAYLPLMDNGVVAGVAGVDFSVEYINRSRVYAHIALAGALIISALAAVFLSRHVQKTIVAPVLNMKQVADALAEMRFDVGITKFRNDELGDMQRSLSLTRDNLQKTFHDLQAELSHAAEIQRHMLPPIPAVIAGAGYGMDLLIHADMVPAAYVGGDFYDFFFLNTNRSAAAFVIGDVSGKGIPAALFMVVSKTLIKQELVRSGDPAAAMELVNRMLCEDNPLCMFVTMFILVIDFTTGEALTVNGGHNPPLYAPPGEQYRFMELAGSPPLGLIETASYKMGTLALVPGSRLYLYTDGVNEAVNSEKEEWGNEAFLAEANRQRGAAPGDLDRAIREAIRRHSGGAEQSDDITTIAIAFEGKN